MFDSNSETTPTLDNSKKRFFNKQLIIVFFIVALITLSLIGYLVFSGNLSRLFSGKDEVVTLPVSEVTERDIFSELQDESLFLTRETDSLNFNKNSNYLSRIKDYYNKDSRLKVFSQAGSTVTFNGIFDKMSITKAELVNENNYILTLNSFDFTSKIDLVYSQEEIDNAKIVLLGRDQVNTADITLNQVRNGQFIFIKEYYNYFNDRIFSDLYIEVRSDF